jgi:hypothetical protein
MRDAVGGRHMECIGGNSRASYWFFSDGDALDLDDLAVV